MYRDLEILRDKNGRPISQYLDVVDGKFKPITKDNYPELQKVKDEDVKTELESIKQTQSEILERLDGTFDAQLSGSNVEQLETKSRETVSLSRTGTIDVGVLETVFEYKESECILHSLAVGTDYNNMSIYIEPWINGRWGEKIGVASPNGAIYTPSPKNLKDYSGGTNDFFRLQVYEYDKKEFVVTMMREMPFAKGFRIRVLNQNSSNDHTLSLSGLITKKY